MIRYLIVVFSLGYIFLSCCKVDKDKSYFVKKIDLTKCFQNTQNLRLSTIGDTLTYIPLETKKECLIGRVEKCIVNEYGIFILSSSLINQSLYFFNKNGNFNKAIGSQGRGPGEYANIIDFEVINDRILISSSIDGVLVYDTSGVLLKSIKVRSIVNSIIGTQSRIYLFHTFPFNYYNNDYVIDIINNQSFSLEDKLLLRRTSSENKKKIGSFPLLKFNSLIVTGDTAIYWDFSCDTIYSLINKKLIPRYLILKNPIVFSPKLTDYLDLNAYMSSNTKKGVLTKYLETKDYLMFLNTIVDFEVFHLFYNKSDSTYFSLNSNIYNLNYRQNSCFTNDIDDGWPFFPIGITSSNELYGYFEPIDFLHYQESRKNCTSQKWKQIPILNKLSFNSNKLLNPIVMLVK